MKQPTLVPTPPRPLFQKGRGAGLQKGRGAGLKFGPRMGSAGAVRWPRPGAPSGRSNLIVLTVPPEGEKPRQQAPPAPRPLLGVPPAPGPGKGHPAKPGGGESLLIRPQDKWLPSDTTATVKPEKPKGNINIYI